MTPVHAVFAAMLASALLLPACSSKQKSSSSQKNSKTDTVLQVLQSGEDTLQLQTLSGEFINYAVQKFFVPKATTKIVTGKKGLKVTVNPSALEKADGAAVDGAVEVRLVELTNSAELFNANAATLSNGRLLVSGGSYFVEMFCNGESLRVKKGKSISVDFPVLSSNEMELFYGSRDVNGNMNWISAGQLLNQISNPWDVSDEEILFTDSNRYSVADYKPSFMYDTIGNAKIYATLNEKVYYYENKLTIKQLVDTINRNSFKIFLDTVYMWPKRPANIPADARIDSNFLYRVYGPPKQFIIKRCKEAVEEEARKEKAKLALQQAQENWRSKTLAGQLQKYYATVNITSLGWLNCDRFYLGPQNSDVEVELPITFNNSRLHYFLVCKEFMGLINGSVKPDSVQQYRRLKYLPNNQNITLIGFVKSNDKIYQCKKDFTVKPNTSIKPVFEEISVDELKKQFGNNIRI